jgi:RNA polymerase sigma-70 factor (ECF subfamily)
MLTGGDNMFPFFMANDDPQEDRDLFEDLYIQYKAYMIKVANSILLDSDEAENIVHEAFAKLMEKKKVNKELNLRNGHKTQSLIGIIVSGLAKDEYRKRIRRIPTDDETIEKFNPVAARDVIIEREQYEALKAAIYQLDTVYSHTLLLKHEHQLSNSEIAELTGVSEEVVRQRLHRAKMKLKEILAKEAKTK